MANKYDLKTWTASALTSAAAASSTGTNIGGAAVAAGKTRFLTYIRVTRTGPMPSAILPVLEVHVGSVTTSAPSTASVVGGRKIKINLPRRSATTNLNASDVDVVQEIRGTLDQPILSVGGGGWMGLFVSGAAEVHTQYFDE